MSCSALVFPAMPCVSISISEAQSVPGKRCESARKKNRNMWIGGGGWMCRATNASVPPVPSCH
eukprot:6172557-Pleurochrysis_carterae.AAC.7